MSDPLIPRVHTLLHAGHTTEALALVRQALVTRGDEVELLFLLGGVHGRLGQSAEAEAALRRAIALGPDVADLYYNLGNALRDQGRIEEAAGSYRRALELAGRTAAAAAPRWADAWNNLGNALKDQGRGEEALAAFREALRLHPGNAGIHSNLLFSLNYGSHSGCAEICAEHRRWAALHADLLPRTASFPNTCDPDRRLRLGYVSPDFRRHAAAHFIKPLLAHHDHGAFEVYCYSNVARPDDNTDYFRSLTDHWRDVRTLTDEQLAAQVRADAIDILVDLAGHTDGGRLLAFARRPAPVQGSFIGYPNTTGLATIDFRITDAVCNPPESEPYFTERLIRLPSRYCYEPPPDLPEPGPPPLAVRGYPTFASFNNLAKITPEVIALWAQVLAAVPAARLVLQARSLTDAATRADVVARFAAQGVSAARLEVRGATPLGEYLEGLRQCDIALDPFPFNGGTTSYHALWMGLPVVTLTGETYMSRVGTSLLHTLDLADIVARTPQDYVRIARELAGDSARLSQLRAGLRTRMAASWLTDGRGYTAAVEDAYRGLWRTWCARNP